MRQSLMPRLCRLPLWRYVAMLAPLALPNCNQVWGLDGTKGAPDVPRLNPGGLPRQYAILCDIESRRVPRRCATAGEVAADAFVTQSSGAVALTVRQTHNAAFDYSDDAKAECAGLPQVVTYEGQYPEGSPVCVKYLDVIGPAPYPYADPNDVCVALCNDLNRASDGDVPPEAAQFCAATARASTNYPLDSSIKLFGFGGFLGACTNEGVLRPDFDVDDPQLPQFIDPRRVSEPVQWDVLKAIGVSVSGSAGNNLTRTSAGNNFDAGIAAKQAFTRGDGYVEFIATETNRRRRIGLGFGMAPDPSPTEISIEFAIELGSDGNVRVFEAGNVKVTLGAYVAGQRFRIRVTDRNSLATARDLVHKAPRALRRRRTVRGNRDVHPRRHGACFIPVAHRHLFQRAGRHVDRRPHRADQRVAWRRRT